MSRNPFDEPFCRSDMSLKMLQEKFNRLEQECSVFFRSCKYEEFSVVDKEKKIISYRAKSSSTLSPEIAYKFSEIMSDMKHLLDQAVYSSIKYTSGVKSKSCHFPSGRQESDFENSIRRFCIKAGMHPDVTEVVRKSKCFASGNHLLYQVAVFARNKHRDFVALDFSVSGGEPRHGFIDNLTFQIVKLEDENCVEYATAPITAYNNIKVSIHFAIMFTEPRWLLGHNAIEITRKMIEKTIVQYEAIKVATFALNSN